MRYYPRVDLLYPLFKDPKKLKAKSEFPSPTNITELRSFLGLVNQLIQFTPNLAVNCAPLRTLLNQYVPCAWTEEHEH